MPALLTRMSRRPKRSTVRRTISRHDFGSATSSGTKALAAPEASSLATAASDFSRLRAATTIGGARFRQALGHAEPDAAIAAGDDCDAPGKIERLHDDSPPVRLPRALREFLRQSPRFGNRRQSGREETKPLRRVVERRAVSGLSTTIPDNAGYYARPDRDGVGDDRADRRDG